MLLSIMVAIKTNFFSSVGLASLDPSNEDIADDLISSRERTVTYAVPLQVAQVEFPTATQLIDLLQHLPHTLKIVNNTPCHPRKQSR
jgi:hypothetical protein